MDLETFPKGSRGREKSCRSAGKLRSGAFARCVGEEAQRERSEDIGTKPEHEGEEAERSGFPAEGQARIRGGMSAAVLRSERQVEGREPEI